MGLRRLFVGLCLGLAQVSYVSATPVREVKAREADNSQPLLTRASFDLVVETFRADNPNLARGLSEEQIETLWAELAGESPNIAKRAAAAEAHSKETRERHKHIQRRAPPSAAALSHARSQVSGAVRDVEKAINSTVRNPRRNQYSQKPDSSTTGFVGTRPAPVNSTVAEAAAVVAEADVAALVQNGTLDLNKDYRLTGKYAKYNVPGLPTGSQLDKRDTAYWLTVLGPIFPGSWPYGDAGYKVYRNVKDYGAVGDGKTDDTAAINAAIADGNRCGNGCGTSSVKGALVYFPSGTYLVSSSIYSLYNTQLVGDPGSWPVLLVAPSFTGAGVITSDVYIGDNIEWYKSQSNFYRQVRNFLIDMSHCQTSGIWGVHWQVGQATSLQNIFFQMTDSSTSTQVGIFAEDGSGGFMSDLFFYEGNTGITCGNQQFTVRDLNFFSTWRAVSMLWDWGWTWKGLNVLDSTFGIWFQSSNVGGSMYVLDSSFENVVTAFFITTPTAGLHQEVLLNLDNFAMKNVATGVLTSNFTVPLAGGTRTVAGWTYGQIYDAKTPNGRWVIGEESALHPVTPALTTSSGSYFTSSKPQYSGTDGNAQWVTAQLVAKGDGVTDDTAALALLFSVALQFNYNVFIPAGSYIITDTLKIPTGVNVVGACWAQIVATGANFTDVNNPRVVVQVGAPNDVGSVQIQDLLITVKGNTAGAILMEWNTKQSSQGSAAMWDTHFRIGGAKGTGLTATDCPTLTGKINPKCIAASMTLHVTKSASAYLENVWAWTADHDLDTTSETQVDIYTARGVLIESQGPVWMYGTASEHAALYQYALDGAKDVFMGMIQTESPYYYPAPVAPQPFNTTGQFPGDPSFASCQTTGCKAAWALTLNSSSNVQIAGAGLYSWYSNNYSQDCVDTQNCQDSLVTTQNSGDVYLLNLYTVGATNMVVPDPAVSLPTIKAAANTFQNAHPFVAGISRWQYTH